MRLIVFGASGQCGRHLVQLADAAGHTVTAVVREGTEFVAPRGVAVVRGDPTDAEFVAEVMPGHDAVASGLGIKRRSPANPWSKLASPPDLCSRAARNIVAGMQAAGLRRVCAISAAGVGESAARMNWLMKFFVATSSVGAGYRDLAAMEQVYADSGLDWQTPRPTRLTDEPATGEVAETDAFPLTAAISRADVAAYMLAQLMRPAFALRTPTITGA